MANPSYSANTLKAGPWTLSSWINNAKETTNEVRNNGSLTPFAWIFVEGNNIPPNAIIGGYDRERPLYIVRRFVDGDIRIGHVGKHLKSGAVLVLDVDTTADVPAYEILVEMKSQSRWVLETPTQITSVPPARHTSLEQRLKEIKTVIIVDDSHSMKRHWGDTKVAFADIAEKTKEYSADGLDIYFLNNQQSRVDVTDRQTILALFDAVKASGETPTGKKLKEILNIYIPRVEECNAQHKPISIVVLTDGVPTEDPSPEDVIVQAARRLEKNGVPPRMLGIQFVQIGNDPRATEALRELDNELEKKHKIRDMVDTILYDPKAPDFHTEKMIKILMGSVDDPLDNDNRFSAGSTRAT